MNIRRKRWALFVGPEENGRDGWQVELRWGANPGGRRWLYRRRLCFICLGFGFPAYVEWGYWCGERDELGWSPVKVRKLW